MGADAVSSDAAAKEGAQAEEVVHQSPSTSQVTPILVCNLHGETFPVTS